MARQYVGHISIVRSSHDQITIAVVDTDSHSKVAEVTLTPETLGLILTGLSYQPCTFTADTRLLGTRREHKTEIVPVVDCKYEDRLPNARVAVSPFEVDGWQARVTGALNQHNQRGRLPTKDGSLYEVAFERWVPVEAAPEEGQ